MDTEGKFFYSNGLELAVSPFDFNLKFLRQGAPQNAKLGEKSQPTTLDEMIVAVSPSHAKAILAGLYRAVMDYEATYGPIGIPPEAQSTFDQQFGSLIKK